MYEYIILRMIISKAKIKLNSIRYNLRVPSNRVAIVSRKVFWGASKPFPRIFFRKCLYFEGGNFERNVLLICRRDIHLIHLLSVILLICIFTTHFMYYIQVYIIPQEFYYSLLDTCSRYIRLDWLNIHNLIFHEKF